MLEYLPSLSNTIIDFDLEGINQLKENHHSSLIVQVKNENLMCQMIQLIDLKHIIILKMQLL